MDRLRQPGGRLAIHRPLIARACSGLVDQPTFVQTVGRAAIRDLWAAVLEHRPHFEQEEPLPTLVSDGIALTSTPPQDGAGARAQVVRRQSDGSWLRLLDYPEFVPPPARP